MNKKYKISKTIDELEKTYNFSIPKEAKKEIKILFREYFDFGFEWGCKSCEEHNFLKKNRSTREKRR